ncbi:MAG TPA: FAD-binding oxidoreductase [Candidatus Tectomicrobia bacterium]|nr:FAD-binding oxidoreductase [Candidatus Tectomicrobia bacterium]
MQQTPHPWGDPVWSFPIAVAPSSVPEGWHIDVAVVGAGFTGLATACYVLQRAPSLRVAVFEARQVGAGASGRTGGLVLEDTAVGPLPGVEDCIATLQELVSTEHIACDLHVGGCWEIGRYGGQPCSPIQWDDHGTLKVVNFIPGGAFDPRKFLAGLAAAVEGAGGHIFEQTPVTGLDVASPAGVQLEVRGKVVYAERAVFATNAFCLPLLGLQDRAGGVHTIAVATEPLGDAILDDIGWTTRTPFYTLDQPYLWGRVTAAGRAVIGAGLIGRGDVEHARVDSSEGVRLFESLEHRIRGLRPALRRVRITHRWMGPLCFTHDSKPIIASIDADGRVLVATGYHGHGVALSVRVGKLLAAALTGQGELPAWSDRPWSRR